MAISVRCSTDHRGPLVPPPGVDVSALTPDELDAAIVRLLELQQDQWLSVVTDGELRRLATDAPPDPVAEAEFLTQATDLLVKIRVPRSDSGAIADRDVLAALIDLGVGYLELDASHYAPLMHGETRRSIDDPDTVIERMLATDEAVLQTLNIPADVKVAVCFHDPISPASAPFTFDLDEAATRRITGGLSVNRFVLDVAPAPVPDYSFLAWFPDSAEITLCLVDHRADELVDAEVLYQEILRAGDVVDVDRLALGTRSGFFAEPGADGRAAWDHERAALTVLLDGAARSWGIDF